jgi:hypothetical protein
MNIQPRKNLPVAPVIRMLVLVDILIQALSVGYRVLCFCGRWNEFGESHVAVFIRFLKPK